MSFEEAPDQPGPRPLLTLTEAAHATGVSRSTLRRRVEGGQYPAARKDPQRGWLIPVEELLADGLTLSTMGRPVSTLTARPTTPSGRVHHPMSAVTEHAHNRSPQVSAVDPGTLTERAHLHDGDRGVSVRSPREIDLEQQVTSLEAELQRVREVGAAELRGAREVITEVRHRAETAERALLMLTDGRGPEPRPDVPTRAVDRAQMLSVKDPALLDGDGGDLVSRKPRWWRRR